tara:strand:+ start:692 stop:1336 length:645 start_codon:yes stop_codon:yes gene_type:complete
MNIHNNIIANQYDLISDSFDNSRVRIWNTVKQFLNDYNENDTLLDCGCGNGKNMIYANNIGYNSEGFDISNSLLKICIKKNLNVYYYDVLNFNSTKKYNKILAIAILHHLETEKEQKNAIINLLNSLYEKGTLLISFWSKEKNFNNENYLKNKIDYRDFQNGPNYVKWKLTPDNIINRFYYIHDYNSITELAKSIGYNYIITWELQNWFILFFT